MTSKERIFATMNFEPVDRPAVFPLEGSAWICKKHGLSYDDMFKLPDYGAQLLVDSPLENILSMVRAAEVFAG